MTEDLHTDIINRYFEGGWRIAPFCKSKSGYIGLERWTSRPAKNTLELQNLLEEARTKFRGNIIFGVVSPPGRYIVDIDVKKNLSALQLWQEKVRDAYGSAVPELPSLVVKTKSGGYHLYYSTGDNNSVRSPTGVFGKDSGIDIRGATGMVVMPSGIGTEEDWSPGDYIVIRGTPNAALTTLPLYKILPNAASENDRWENAIYEQLNDVIRNSHISEMDRWRFINPELTIPASNRDNMLFRIARLCRHGGLSIEAANAFIKKIAAHCEITPDDSIDHWVGVGLDKIKRIYGDAKELELNTVAALYNELDNSGCVLVSSGIKASYYFTKNSAILDIKAGEQLSEEVFKIRMRGTYVYTDEGNISATKLIAQYRPKKRAYAVALHPRNVPFFEFENQEYVNNYVDPFINIRTIKIPEINIVDSFKDFIYHIVGGSDDDMDLMLKKIAWIIQHPDRRRPVATFIYSKTRGVGKDIFADLLAYFIGVKYAKRMPIEALSSQFTNFNDSILTIISEVQIYAGGYGVKNARDIMGRIKSLITEKSMVVNQKFMQPYSAPIYTNFLLLSNYEPSAIIEPGDRRMEVFHASEEKFNQSKFGLLADLTNNAYWYNREAERFGYFNAIREFLCGVEIEDSFDRTTAEMNEVKNDIIAEALPAGVKWLISNLPSVFTRELVQYAATICPFKIMPEYAFDQLRDNLVNELARYGDSKAFRKIMGPSIIKHRNMSGPDSITLSFESTVSTQLYVIRSRPYPVNISGDQAVNLMKAWFNNVNDTGLPAKVQQIS